MPKLPFRKTFQWSGNVAVEPPLEIIPDRLRFGFSGELTFEFRESKHRGLAELHILKDRFTVGPISLTMGRGPRFLREALSLDEFSVNVNKAQLSKAEGYIELKSGNFTLNFTLKLTSNDIPVLKLLGIDKLPVLVHQTGCIDIEKGRIDANGRVSVAPDYAGKFQFLALFGKDSCPTWVTFAGSVDGSKPTQNTTLFITEGEDVHLWWESSKDVNSANIIPRIGAVSATGDVVVRVNESTTFKIETVGGKCVKSSEVEVRVVRSGDKIHLSAPFVPRYELFQYVYPKQFCSMKILISYIEPACGPNCYQHSWKQGNYLSCSGVLCVGEWSGQWIPPGSGLGIAFGVGIMLNPLPIPNPTLAGTWDFYPTVISGNADGSTAFFILTVA